MSAYMILLLCDCSASPKKVQHALDFGCCARVSSGLQRRVSRAGLGRRAELKAEMSGWALVKDGSGCYTRAQKNLHGPSERRIQYTSCNQLDRRRVEGRPAGEDVAAAPGVDARTSWRRPAWGIS
jgi:hypothetical protein